MTDTIYLDIETIPSQSPELLARFMAEVKAPATYKKQDNIDAWLAENRESAAREAMAKTSFDPAHGHICTIAWAVGDHVIHSCHASTVAAETAVLSNFFADLDDYHSQVFVGHYINGFDLRFILCRAVVLGVKIPRCIPRDPKPWGNSCFDTMTAWAGQRGTISMDNLSRALSIEGKGDFDGSMVAEAWANGEHAKIEEYCRHDVQVVRDIHRKFMAAGW